MAKASRLGKFQPTRPRPEATSKKGGVRIWARATRRQSRLDFMKDCRKSGRMPGEWISEPEVWVDVGGKDPEPVRRFETFTAELQEMGDWLKRCGIETVAMESTGVYWIPVFQVLEERGIDVLLVNARYAKNVSGRKTDMLDCQWLRTLHTYGLLAGSFQPSAEIGVLRSYLRQRQMLIDSAATHIQHMQ